MPNGDGPGTGRGSAGLKDAILHAADDDHGDVASSKTRSVGSNCRLCRQSCSDRASLQHHLIQVHRVKPQVLQFLLDLVEIQSETSTNNTSAAESLPLDDNERAVNDETDECQLSGGRVVGDGDTSVPCVSSFPAASLQRTDHTASKSAEGAGSELTDGRHCPASDRSSADRTPDKESDVHVTPDDVGSYIEANDSNKDVNVCCAMMTSDSENVTDLTRCDTSECHLELSVHDRFASEKPAAQPRQPALTNSDETVCSSDVGREGFRCEKCSRIFLQVSKMEEHACGFASPECRRTPEGSMHPECKNQNDATSEERGHDDVSVQEDPAPRDKLNECWTPPPPLPQDLTWNTLTGMDSPNRQFESDVSEQPMKVRAEETGCDGLSAESCQPVQETPLDCKTRTDRHSDDSKGEGLAVASAAWLDSSRLFSSAVSGLLLDIGLDCVIKFNRLFRRSGSRGDVQPNSELSKSDDDDGSRWQDENERETAHEADSSATEKEDCAAPDAERRRRLTCFYCLQRFADAHSLQTHFETTHGQESVTLHSSRSDHHHDSTLEACRRPAVGTDLSALSSTTSGHVTAPVWNKLPDNAPSYYGGMSPELAGLLSSVPPELMLPHVYPGGMLPPAMLMMMLASPFVGCPSSPLPSSAAAAAVAETRPGFLASPNAAEARLTQDDAGVEPGHQSKRARTRISDAQLTVLRARFDISGPPNDDEIEAIGSEIGLPVKVVKHWFRNTLFKERQRCKDSPYNFSVPPVSDPPPVSALAAAAAGKTADTSVMGFSGQAVAEDKDHERQDIPSDSSSMSTPAFDDANFFPSSSSQTVSSTAQCVGEATGCEAPYLPFGCYFGVPYAPAPQPLSLLPSAAQVPPVSAGGGQIASMASTSTGNSVHHPATCTQSRGGGGHGKRASRTHFSDEQVRTLQEHFERNAYPRDDELESLSRRLGLSARVIVVWFQNARQKARRTYENHSTGTGTTSAASKTDDGLGAARYDCRSCGAAFQRYYELIKHQRSHAGCGSLVTSTTKYCLQPPEASPVCASKHNRTQLRYDEHLHVDSAATAPRPSYRQHKNNRHHPHHLRPDSWCRPVGEGYAGTVGVAGSYCSPEIVNSLPLQHALPGVFPGHLPLLTSWSNASRRSEEAAASSGSLGVDMTSNTRPTDQSDRLLDRNCETIVTADCRRSDESADAAAEARNHNTDHYHDDSKHLRKDFAVPRSPKHESPLASADDEPSQYLAEMKRHPAMEMKPAQLHRTVTSPSSAVAKFGAASTGQDGRQLFGGGELIPAEESPPSLHFHDNHADAKRVPLIQGEYCVVPRFNSNSAVDQDETPLDLSCQCKPTWSTSDSSSCAVANDSGVVRENLAPISPTISAGAGAGDVSGGGTPAAKVHQSSGASKRHRTHMSELQVRVMRAIYIDHRTPSIGECATLGAKIGLARRVVQVWFQNARAKDKKRCLTEPGGGGVDEGCCGPADSDAGMVTGDGRCRWCGVTYSVETCSVREHVFSPEHVAAVDRTIRASTDAERRGSAGGGRAAKRDHRRRLLHRSITASSPTVVPQMPSSSLSATSPSCTPQSSDALIAGRHVTSAAAAAVPGVSAVMSDHGTSSSSSTVRHHPSSSSSSSSSSTSELAAAASEYNSDTVMAGAANMFPPPYVVKFPHSTTGVVPFLYPGYGGLFPSGFAPSRLPITGGNGLNYGGGCDPALSLGYGLPRQLLTAGAPVAGSARAGPWKAGHTSQHVNGGP